MSRERSRRGAAGERVERQELAFEILRSLRRILRKTAERSRQLRAEGGLSIPQVLCLRVIGKAGKGQQVTAAQVAAAIQLSAATVSRILDRLEEAGLVRRERTTSDRRKVSLSLTPEGTRRLRKIPTPLHEQFLERLVRLPEGEQRGMLSCLERIVRMMDAEGLDAAPLLTPDFEAGPPEQDAGTS